MTSTTVAGLVFEDFKDRVGSVFTVAEDGIPAIPMTLDEAKPLPARYAPVGGRAPFSLMFRGADMTILPQKLYRLRHAAMGEVEIFLVPVGKDDRGISYQATFN
jgi:hypothetical protein